ncbi:MAG: hypothetical protein OSA87_01350 [Woeseiaceae bacterium]|nr:hypothetical protein [Woeseiaceae bacterium]
MSWTILTIITILVLTALSAVANAEYKDDSSSVSSVWLGSNPINRSVL